MEESINECQCPKYGWCNVYNHYMTYDPPNWQWCQAATPEERVKWRGDCAKRLEKKRISLKTNYITNRQLIEDCRNLLLPQVAQLNLKGVLGIPRSGILPASMLAIWLNLPLYALDCSGNPFVLSGTTEFGGVRMKNFTPNNGRLLVVDDTVYSGTAIKNLKNKLLQDAFYATVYAHPKRKNAVDFFARELSPPHLLEWNLFNCVYTKDALLDFDGILSPNVPHEVCLDEEKYIDYIKNVEPFYDRIPKTPCRGIVTARLEKYRDITENWLERHGINYGFLKMYPTEKEEIRNKNHIEEAAKFKADVFSSSDAHFFIESEPAEAVIIQRISNKFVICLGE